VGLGRVGYKVNGSNMVNYRQENYVKIMRVCGIKGKSSILLAVKDVKLMRVEVIKVLNREIG
jgi:hypothetical protein